MKAACEWNPVFNILSTEPLEEGDCPNEATWRVGHDGQYHLCDSCAALPFFKRYKSRARLRQQDETRRA